MSNEEELRKIVISNWQEKLLRFQIEESITNDTGKKLELAKLIEEWKQKKVKNKSLEYFSTK